MYEHFFQLEYCTQALYTVELGYNGYNLSDYQ